MPPPLLAISGATGHIGSEICHAAVAAGAHVRGLGRDAGRIQALGGVEPAIGSLDDAMGLKKALAGANGVFAMIPPNLATSDFRAYARRTIDSFMQAIPASGATHVVVLSSIGAEVAAGTGPIAALHEMEERFSGLTANVLILRPAYFLENHFGQMGLIRNAGIMGSPLRGDLAVPMIATRDIAAVAVKRLLARDFKGTTVLELHGAKDYTMSDVARTLGKEIGKPDLAYMAFPYEDAEKAMASMGMSPTMARLFVEMTRAFNDGLIKPTQPRSPATTTPTTLGQFAKIFAAAFRGG